MDLKNIRDRGIQKWQGFFMNEHVSKLKELREEMESLPKPIIDEYQKSEFDQKLSFALHSDSLVKITTWQFGSFEYFVGRIHSIHSVNQNLKLQNLLNEIEVIPLEEVVNVELEDEFVE